MRKTILDTRIYLAAIIFFYMMPGWVFMPAGLYAQSKVKFNSTSEKSTQEKTAVQKAKEKEKAQKDMFIKRALEKDRWYVKLSTNVNYFNLGSEFKNVISEIEGLFAGEQIALPLMTFNTAFSMQTADPVKRAPTHFVPTGNIGIGYYFGKHRIEVEFGLAGMVPLKTVDIQTQMTLTEAKTCSSSNISDCPMANLGFVNDSTGKGQYDFEMIINEDIWALSPSIYYDYMFDPKPWGQLSAGAGAGLMILSTAQKIQFKATRTDLATDSTVTDPYRSRVLEGAADSTNLADMGPLFRLYAGYRPPFYMVQTEFRLGVNYGFVNLNRDVDGSGVVLLGNSLVASFPTTALGFDSRETNKFEMAGFFIQAGMVF